MSAPERIVPDTTEPGIVALHLKRYEFARPHCAGRHVLDAGCGVGYGSAYLAESARRVIGVDVSPEAIAYARDRYSGPSVEFVVGDLLALDRRDGEFDVVCAFEVIEHLPDAERFLEEARRVLADNGVFIVSTPRADTTDDRPANPHHEREYSIRDFERLLRTRFDHVQVYGQRRVLTARHRALRRLDVLGLRRRVPVVRRASRIVTGTSAMDDVSTEGIVISEDGIGEATELVAVCRP